jgi:hypothetical protein
MGFRIPRCPAYSGKIRGDGRVAKIERRPALPNSLRNMVRLNRAAYSGKTPAGGGGGGNLELWDGISQIIFGPNSVYFHGGEMPGYNSFMLYDPLNDVTLIIWTSLTISLDGQPTANTIMLKMLDQIYTASLQ